ncbi:MAG: hypothetical protein AAF081_08685 [Actinomycetota bacterium]
MTNDRDQLDDSQRRIDDWLGAFAVPRHHYSADDLDAAEQARGAALPAALREVYEVIGSGPFLHFEILSPDDPYEYTSRVFEEIQLFESEGWFDNPNADIRRGELPRPSALAFGASEVWIFLYEEDPSGESRVVLGNSTDRLTET